jgi:hypothetical protein
MQLEIFARPERTSLTLFIVLIASGVSVAVPEHHLRRLRRERHVRVLTVQEARSLAHTQLPPAAALLRQPKEDHKQELKHDHARLPPAAALLFQRWGQRANRGDVPQPKCRTKKKRLRSCFRLSQGLIGGASCRPCNKAIETYAATTVCNTANSLVYNSHVRSLRRSHLLAKRTCCIWQFQHTKPYTGKTTVCQVTGEFLEKPKLSVQHRFDDVTDRP